MPSCNIAGSSDHLLVEVLPFAKNTRVSAGNGIQRPQHLRQSLLVDCRVGPEARPTAEADLDLTCRLNPARRSGYDRDSIAPASSGVEGGIGGRAYDFRGEECRARLSDSLIVKDLATG